MNKLKFSRAVLRENAPTLVIFTVLAAAIIIVFGHVIMLTHIPSGSMENTIMPGDILVATRYDKKNIQRYDIMVFIPPDDASTYYIKRVIGLPGETILVEDGEVYADGVQLDKSFLHEWQYSNGDGIYQVPENCYFMLGDNRNRSSDSRFWETKYVPLENMMAKAKFVIFPFGRVGSVTYERDQQQERGGYTVNAPDA